MTDDSKFALVPPMQSIPGWRREALAQKPDQVYLPAIICSACRDPFRPSVVAQRTCDPCWAATLDLR